MTMADYGSRCVMLAVGLLLWGLTVVQPASVRVKAPKGCTVESLDGPFPNLLLFCQISPRNINGILYEMKQPQFSNIALTIAIEFQHFQLDDEAFNPNLHYLSIIGYTFSTSPGTFRGLSKLEGLYMNNHKSDGTYKGQIKELEINGITRTTFPLNINYTSPLLCTGWLAPLTNLHILNITETDISSFSVEEFCTLNQLQALDVSQNRINSTEGLGITCNSSSCTPCLPNVTGLDISGNPIKDLTLNISTNLPNLKVFNIAHCDLSVLYFSALTSESIEVLDVSNNKLHSVLIDEELPCIRPHLHHLNLQNNQLHIISQSLFLCMPHLQFLNLSGNALTGETLISAGLNSLTEIKWLDLSHNNINTLQPALIGNMTKLRGFLCTACSLTKLTHNTFNRITDLSYLLLNNNNLSMIKAGSFSHFLVLQGLDLSRNTLKEIILTENLISLTVLDLSDNLLSEIPDFSGSWLNNLSTLIMNSNWVTDMDPKQMSSLINLKYLSLAFNKIEFIPDDTFANQIILETLVLSSNSIKSISEFGLDRLPSLTHLSLDNNVLTELPPFKLFNMNELMFLNLSRNHIKTMNLEYGFSLRWIDLSHNDISQIKFHLSVFKYLQYLNYSYNHLSILDSSSFMTETLPRAKLYLQGNVLHVDCHSEWLLDTKLDKSYGYLHEKRMKRYEATGTWTNFSEPNNKDNPHVKITDNSMITQYYAEIADLDLLQCTTATGESKSFSELSSADFVCQYAWYCSNSDCGKDCCEDVYGCPCSTFCYPECTCFGHMYIVSINSMNCSSRNMTSLPSEGPSYVRSITLDGNYLTAINSSSLNFPYLIKLNAANSNISHLPPRAFSNLRRLQILHLQQNNIEKISKQTFIFLINLEELYLQKNKIHQIDNGSFDDLQHLKTLWLHGNNLKYLHLSLFARMYSLRQLTLQDNSWSCDCQSGPAFKDLLIHSEIIVNRLHIYCNNTVPSDTGYNTGSDSSQYNMTNNTLSLHYQAVIDIDFSACTNRSVIERVYHHTVIERVHTKSITEVVSLAAVFAVLVIFTLVIYKTRLLIRVWIYNKFGVLFHREEDDNDDKPYHLFIAYAKADERLVMYDLLHNLEAEEMSYKVCLECRDWPPGATTTDAVVASVQLSKRTIVLVSPNHLDTQWCEYSFDAAHYQVLLDKQIRLILVLTDIELQARMTRAMKLYMKTNTFLVIGERWFWKKLRYYLAVNPRGADHVVGREFRLMNAY